MFIVYMDYGWEGHGAPEAVFRSKEKMLKEYNAIHHGHNHPPSWSGYVYREFRKGQPID